MFVITIGPIGRRRRQIIKIAVALVVLVVIALIAWRLWGAASDHNEIIMSTLSAINDDSGGGLFWQRWLGSLRQWFYLGF